MAHRRLGRTGFALSPIGFGAFKIGRNQGIKYAQDYALPDDHEVDRLLNGVLDLGVNYIDTAPAYGLSEERIGRAIAHRKTDFVLSTKVGELFESGRSTFDFSQRAARQSIERSRARLRLDVLDIVYVHSDGDDLQIINHTGLVETLQALQEDGSIKAIGFSGKTSDGAWAALDWADVLMVEYHMNDQSHAPVIAEAGRRGVGVIVKKGLASGRLNPLQAIPFVLGNQGVASMVIGGLSLEHFRDNVRIAESI